MKIEIKITGQAEDPVAVAQAAIDAVAGAGIGGGRANVSFGNVQGWEPVFPESEVAASQRIAGVVEEQASVMAVSFASSKGAALADELNVPASAFEGVVPSGKKGFTVGDVRGLASG